MAEITRLDLTDADGGEVTQHLIDRGWTTAIETWVDAEGLHVSAANVSAQTLTDALATFAPTVTRGEWIGPLPEELRTHAAHIRDFGRLDAAGIAALTEAQRWHVVRDVCRALALLVDRRLD